MLDCVRCHALVHAQELEAIANEAKALETQHKLLEARQLWEKALLLLPSTAKQAEWIRNHTLELYLAADHPEDHETTPQSHAWAKKLGPLGPIAILLAKGKALLALLKFPFLLSFVSFLGVYWALFGGKFGIGFAVLILLHELGHFIDIRRRGLPAEMPVFLPGFGAYVKWQALGVTRETRAAVSLAGPFAGFLSAALCAFLYQFTHNSLWAALARSGAWLNVLNLIPVWVLDGAQAFPALNRSDRLIIVTASLAIWWAFGESVFLLVAAGATWRLFTKDEAPEPSYRTLLYFLTVMLALGLVLRVVPGHGFGRP